MSTQSYHLFSPIVAVKELHYLYLHLPNSIFQDSSKLDQVSGQLLPPPHEPHPSQSYAPRLRSLVEARRQVVCAQSWSSLEPCGT